MDLKINYSEDHIGVTDSLLGTLALDCFGMTWRFSEICAVQMSGIWLNVTGVH